MMACGQAEFLLIFNFDETIDEHNYLMYYFGTSHNSAVKIFRVKWNERWTQQNDITMWYMIR